MTKADREAMRELLTDVLAAHTAEIGGQFQLIKQELGQIKEQTIKTNGRVNKHDEEIKAIQLKNVDHTVHCPNTSRIKALEDSETGRKSTYKTILIIGGGIGTVAMIIIAMLELILK